MLCDFGCSQEAIKTFKSGKHCCAESTSKCPAMRQRNNPSTVSQYDWDDIQKAYDNGMSQRDIVTKFNVPYGVISAAVNKNLLICRSKRDATYVARSRGKCQLSDESRQTMSLKAQQRILVKYENGWLPKAGRCKKYTYVSPVAGEVSLDGTWELKVAKYFDAMNFIWRRNTKRFQYVNLNGNISHYTPDFYVEDFSAYIEVKGYETELDRCKWSQFPDKLLVWKRDKIDSLKESGQEGNAADC